METSAETSRTPGARAAFNLACARLMVFGADADLTAPGAPFTVGVIREQAKRIRHTWSNLFGEGQTPELKTIEAWATKSVPHPEAFGRLRRVIFGEAGYSHPSWRLIEAVWNDARGKTLIHGRSGSEQVAVPDARQPIPATTSVADVVTAEDAASAVVTRGSAVDPTAVAQAGAILRSYRAPAGNTWVSVDDGPLDFDRSPAATDVAAAERPDVVARHANVRRKVQTLLRTLGDRLANYRGWEMLQPAIVELANVVDCLTSELPGRMVDLYDAMVSVASFIDQDNAVSKDPSSLFESLPPDIRRALRDAVATGAPWVRAFPSARQTDEEAGAFLTRRELFEPARKLLTVSRDEGLIADRAAVQLHALLQVGERTGLQGQKAGNRAISTIRNLIVRTGSVLFTLYLGAVGSQIQTGSQLARSAGQLVINAESAMRQLIEDSPADIRAAVDLAIAASKRLDQDGGLSIPAILPKRPTVVMSNTGQHFEPEMVLIPLIDCPLGELEEEARRRHGGKPPPGTFRMGIPVEESMREGTSDDSARPVHAVTIARPFWLARYPLTRGEYAAFVADTGYEKDGGAWRNTPFPQDDRHPVVNVNHQDALAYLGWLNSRTAGGYRLPSEAEWEYACRAGTTTARFWGDAWVGHEPYVWNGRGTAPVDGRKANPFHLHDMLGNVWEWCGDSWHDTYRGAPDDDSVWETNGESVRRVLRGGFWDNDPLGARAGVRVGGGLRNYVTGCRLARTFLTS